METRILTIMFTDLKGFTERTSTQSREELSVLLDIQDELVRPILEKYKGTIIKTIGDAYMVTFESPTNAVHCGVEIQQSIFDYNAKHDTGHHLHMRMGINSGEVSIKNGDIFGEPVNIASRIEGIAEPGEVYFTDSVYLAMNKNEIPSAEVGKRHLKGIAEMVTVYKVLREKGALDLHLAKRKAAAQMTGSLEKGSQVASIITQGKHRLMFAGGALLTFFVALVLWGFLSNNKKIEPPAVQAVPQKATQTMSPIKQQLEKKPLTAPMNELTPVERRILQQRLQDRNIRQ